MEEPLVEAAAEDRENCSENAKHRCVEAGVAVESAVERPADAVEMV